jgi:hypothetical protein
MDGGGGEVPGSGWLSQPDVADPLLIQTHAERPMCVSEIPEPQSRTGQLSIEHKAEVGPYPLYLIWLKWILKLHPAKVCFLNMKIITLHPLS